MRFYQKHPQKKLIHDSICLELRVKNIRRIFKRELGVTNSSDTPVWFYEDYVLINAACRCIMLDFYVVLLNGFLLLLKSF